MEKLFVVGIGPGDSAFLSGRAKNIVEKADRVLSTREMPLAELISALKKPAGGETAVLVSGDCGFFSAAKAIIKDFSDLYDVEALPGIGSIQYFSAKIKISYDDAALISLHGRSCCIVSKVAYNKKVFALTGGNNSVRDICNELSRCGLGGVSVTVGERLSFPDESITAGKADEFTHMDFDCLSVIYIENQSAVNPHKPLKDDDFIRGGVPMTKEEIRWLSIQKLDIMPYDIVYDVGAGTGSVSVEMARKAFDGFVYAFESKEEACALLKENAVKHGAFNIEITHGEAPGSFDGRPKPDKAFIGGSGGNMDGILDALTILAPGIKIVVNAITLQTLKGVADWFERNGVGETEIICVNIAKSKRVGGYDMMAAQNPVYIISGVGGGSHV